jgi:Tfp pilus assembly protein PilO
MKLQNRQKLLTVGAIALVSLFTADKLLITPLGHFWTARSKSIATLQKQVQDGKQLMNRQNSLRGRWDEMRTNTLPANKSLAEQQVLQALDRWAKRSGIGVTSVMPQWKNDADEYSTLECRVEAAGNINTISRFLYDIEKDPMALKLENVEIGSRDADGQQLTLGLQISGLVLAAPPAKQ